MKGNLTSRDISVYLSKYLPESEEKILSVLRKGCSRMTFNRAVHAFALQQRRASRKTALVTANMDVFTETVVPAHTFSSALLIDDSPGMIQSFESFGGYAYRYH